MDIKNFEETVFKRAEELGFEDYEIYSTAVKSFSVNIFKGKIEKYRKNESGGVSFRGRINGRIGYFHTEDLSEEAARLTAEQALENAKIMSSEEDQEIFGGSESYPQIKTYYPELNNISDEEKIELAKKIEKAAYDYSDKIELVTSATVASGEGEVYISNSKGLRLHDKNNSIMAFVGVLASDGKKKKSGGEMFVAHEIEKLDINKLISKACNDAIDQLNAESIEGYSGKVIFKNEAFTSLLKTFAGAFFAETAQKGFSLLKDKEGELIASELVTIADEPLMEEGYASLPFDSEGVASYDKIVVERGILKTLLYNLKTAKKAGKKSTGNGFKGSYKGSVSTWCTNFYIKNGDTDYDSLLKKLKNGVVITEVSGLHAGANPISGDFSLLSQGFLVENGKIIRPVEQIICAGNFFQVLRDIIALASDLWFSIDGIGSPSVLTDNITLSGK